MCSPISGSESVGEAADKNAVGDMAKEKMPAEEDRGRIDNWVTHLTTQSQPIGHRDAIQGLRGLTKTSSINRDYIARKGAIPVVVEVLKDSHEPEVKKHAVTLLLNLSITATLKGTIMAAGAVEPIVEVLKHGDNEARENAAAALFSLSAKGANGVVIGNTDAIPALVQLLIDGTRRGKLDAATAIFDLCICNENKARAVEAGVIPPLVRLLTDKNLRMVDHALSTLALLAVHRQGQAEIGRVNALPILVDLVAESNPQNRENAACVLLELCSNDPNNVYNATKLGLCGALGELASTGTAKARRKAKKLLEIFRHAQHLTGPPGARSI
ncbi:hypothetical protein M758_3G005300 [Ceratodon purpureus]|uniref:U-box domain-containing protein n=1 Tax=Ceratodon purpureus TaxID=3225 RepID=A0A8T0IFW1_CERPU|nr:hypothetical protein KC19_3G007300 [Ceratodon purpureus]KAG0621256.1 hypothetical protein M758_3G005300 [Ceratodon purpureus]